MTTAPEPLDEAIDNHDLTLALTPRQLVLVVIAVFMLLRIIRGMRG